MNSQPANHPGRLPNLDETLRERFEQAWLNGESPAIKDYLPAPSSPAYLVTLEELIQIDLEFVWKGWASKQALKSDATPIERPAPIQNYLRQFPELLQPPLVARMVRQELRVRRENGDHLAADECASKFTQIGIALSDGPEETGRVVSPDFLQDLRKCGLLPSEAELQQSQTTMQTVLGDDTILKSSDPPRVPVPSASSDTVPFDPTAPAAGMQLGQYRLVKKLGEGGMGAVWQAVHQRLRKTVAIKLLSAHLLRDPTLVARFEREMEAIGKVEHPHLVRAYDAGEEHGTHYLVMEFIDGVDLAHRVKKHGPLPLKSALECIRQAALGLAEAHRVGLVHRDIKPGNLMLTRQGHVKVTDLGLARLQADVSAQTNEHTITSAGQILGTPDFMAPEQWDNTHTVDARCDLYALGCTFFFLLTGRAPFSDQTSIARKLQAHELLPPPDLIKACASPSSPTVTPGSKVTRELASAHISAEICSLYEKLMAKKPQDRFQSAAEFVSTLDRLKQNSTSAVFSAPRLDDTFASISLSAATPQLGPKPRPHQPRQWIAPAIILVAIGLAVVGIINAFPNALLTGKSPPKKEKKPTAVTSKSAETPVGLSPAFPTPNYASERDVAAWVLSVGGSLAIEGIDGGYQPASLPLPTTNFQVRLINFQFNTSVRNADLIRLVTLSGLQSLSLHNCPQIGDLGIAHLEGMRTLHGLELTGTGISDRAMKSVAQLTELRTLRLDGCRLTDDGISQLKALPFLAELYVNANENVTMGSLRQLKALPLTNLDIGGTRVRYSDIPELVSCFPHLISFSTRGLEADLADALTPLSQLSQLRDLQLCAHDLLPGIGSRLAQLTNVKSVGVGYSSTPTKEFFAELALARQVEQLGLSDITIDSSALEVLALNPSIRVLALSGQGFGDAEIMTLAGMPALTELHLFATKVSEAGSQQFHDRRPDVTIGGHMNLPAASNIPK